MRSAQGLVQASGASDKAGRGLGDGVKEDVPFQGSGNSNKNRNCMATIRAPSDPAGVKSVNPN